MGSIEVRETECFFKIFLLFANRGVRPVVWKIRCRRSMRAVQEDAALGLNCFGD